MSEFTGENTGHAAPATRPLVELLRVALPTVATMLSYTVMTFADKWLVSRMGAEYVGAQGNGGLAAWVPTALAYGTLQVVNTYVSQNLGAGKGERGAAYAWNGMWMGLAWAVVLVPYALLMQHVFRLAGVDPHQAALATSYGRVLVLGCAFNLMTRALGQFFYGIQRPGVVLVAGVTANVVNIVVSCMMVFGPAGGPADLGLFGRACAWLAGVTHTPAMGITGSAVGTVIATGVELAVTLAAFLGPRLNRVYRTRHQWRWSWERVREIWKIGWPAGLMFGNEMVCWGYFMVYLVSHFGAQHASAGWIAHQYMSLSFMPAVGMSVACTAVVGNYMGRRRPDIAEQRAWLGVRMAAGYMGLCAVAFVVFRADLVRFFIERGTPPEQEAELVRLGSRMLIATAAFQLFDAMAMVLSGSLRGAGDTTFPGVATVVAAWVVIVGGGSAMVRFFPGLESIGAWIAAAAYIFTLCVILLARFLSGRWKSMVLVKHD